MSPNAAVQLIGKIFKAAGVENASSHSLRRTWANKMRRDNGADMFLIQQLLGHSSLATTQKYFVFCSIHAKSVVGKLRF